MLIDCLGTTEEFSELFSDRSMLDAMLRFEAALARAQARLGIIPQSAADSISAVTADKFDVATIAREARDSASVVIPFVRMLRTQPGGDLAHFGATSQDVVDTALVLLLVRAKDVLEADHLRLSRALRTLSERHKDTVMLGRTLLQPASPITFGYKVANWYGGVSRSWKRVCQGFDQTLLVQFGGASGTLAAYGDRGLELGVELAAELNLGFAPPWHTHRDRLAALVADLAIYTGCLGKIARDVALLMQFEVGEVSESGGESSAMPHKRNPSGSAIALAAAARVPALAGAYLGAMVQEHERAAGAWQSEWQIVAAIVSASGSALAAMAVSVESLQVFPERMRANLDATRGAVLSEKALAILAPRLGGGRAHEAVANAVEKAQKEGRTLGEILNVALGDAQDYLGASEMFRRKILEDSE